MKTTSKYLFFQNTLLSSMLVSGWFITLTGFVALIGKILNIKVLTNWGGEIQMSILSAIVAISTGICISVFAIVLNHLYDNIYKLLLNPPTSPVEKTTKN